jgi:hypothetical protein
MAGSLWKTLCEFRLAGLSAHHLDRLAPTPKNLEFARLLHNYEACLKERGWSDLVDHKTDRSPLDALILRYAAQIEQYARSWTDITGETVRSRQIFGVRQGELIEDRSSS